MARSTTPVLTHPIEMTFRRVVKQGGHEMSFDLDVRAGDATDLAIVSPFLPEHAYHEDDILTPATNEIRGIRVSTHRPLFVFSRETDVLLSVQVDLSSGRPRVMATDEPNVRVR